MELLAILFALAAGCCTAVEHTINGRLGQAVTPGVATFHNLVTGALILLVFNVARGNIADYALVTKVSPALLVGGLFGAAIIYLSARAIPVLGVTRTVALLITGELVCGFATDLFVNGMAAGWHKWAGLALLLAGSFLMMR